MSNKVTIKTSSELAKMRVAGSKAASVLNMITPKVIPGVTTNELNQLCHDYIVNELNAIPAPLNYNGYPKSICTSINHVVCHGIPSDKQLKSGDIINIDVTVLYDGYHGDTSKMFLVGDAKDIPIKARRLVEVTKECLWRGISLVKPGCKLGDIGHQIEQHAKRHHYSSVKVFCGHGIGKEFHEAPEVLHYGKANTGLSLQAGMVFTIEPMLNLGKAEVKILDDGWTAITKDRSLSAQWEHTLAVTDSGVEVLTLREEEQDLVSQYLS